MRSKCRRRQACPVTQSGFCIGVVLAWAADARTEQVVVLTLYEMACVKPLNPTVLWLLLAIPEIFFFISDDSSFILVAYLVHWVLRRDIRSRRKSSINSADTTELSTVRYTYCLDCRTEYKNTRFSGVRRLGTAVDSGVMGMTRGEWSYNQFAGDCRFKYEEDWGNIIRARAAYILYYSESVHDEIWLTPVSRWQISHVVIQQPTIQ